MTPSVIARRTAQAHARIAAAAALITAQTASLDASGLAVTHRDPQVQAMLRLENLAAFMADLAVALAAQATPTKKGEKGKKDESNS